MFRKKVRKVQLEERIVNDPARSRQKTMERAVRLLAAKGRSVEELRERLLEKAYTNAEIVDSVLSKLKEYGYLDDDKYAADTAMSKLRQRPQGRRKLEQTMSRKQLDRTTVAKAIDKAFEELPEAKLIDAAIMKRLRAKGPPETREDTKKFLDYLLRQGFGYDLIREKMKHLADLEE